MTVDIEIEYADGKTENRSVTLNRMYNFGSATRNPEDAVAHQEEVAKVGVGIAFDVPAPRVYPISPHNLVTDDEVPRYSGYRIRDIPEIPDMRRVNDSLMYWSCMIRPSNLNVQILDHSRFCKIGWFIKIRHVVVDSINYSN